MTSEIPGTGVGGAGRMPQGHPCGDGKLCIHTAVGEVTVHSAEYAGHVNEAIGGDYDVNHATCPPWAHDRSLPDDNGSADGDPDYQVQRVADDGLSACNDCRRPLFYCRAAGWYFHVDPHAACFLSPAWGDRAYVAPSSASSAEYPPIGQPYRFVCEGCGRKMATEPQTPQICADCQAKGIT